MPHQQDTGGFFVAVMVKKALCAWESQATVKEEAKEGETSEEKASEEEPPKKKCRWEREKAKKGGNQRHRGFNEDPFVYLDEEEKGEDEAFAEIKYE